MNEAHFILNFNELLIKDQRAPLNKEIAWVQVSTGANTITFKDTFILIQYFLLNKLLIDLQN